MYHTPNSNLLYFGTQNMTFQKQTNFKAKNRPIIIRIGRILCARCIADMHMGTPIVHIVHCAYYAYYDNYVTDRAYAHAYCAYCEYYNMEATMHCSRIMSNL